MPPIWSARHIHEPFPPPKQRKPSTPLKNTLLGPLPLRPQQLSKLQHRSSRTLNTLGDPDLKVNGIPFINSKPSLPKAVPNLFRGPTTSNQERKAFELNKGPTPHPAPETSADPDTPPGHAA